MKAESRQAQNTKVVRMEVEINFQLESRRTDLQGARKVAKKTTGSGNPAELGFFVPGQN